MELKFVQINLSHCRATQDMFWQFVREEDISVALVSEYYDVSRPGWWCDLSGRAAIGVLQPGISLSDLEIGDGYVAVTVGGVLRGVYAPSRLGGTTDTSGWSDRVARIVYKVLGYCARVQEDDVRSAPAHCVQKGAVGDGGSNWPNAERRRSARK